MDVFINFLDKFLFLFFILSTLNVLRHGYYFTQAILKSDENKTIKYKLNDKGLFLLGLSISYILTYIIK